MDHIAFVFKLVSYFFAVLTIERTMSVFFEKRRTSFIVGALSYLFFFISLILQESSRITTLWFVSIYFISLVMVSFNYESIAMKRAAAVGVSHYLVLLITSINTILATYIPTTLGIDNESLALIITCIFIYLLSLTVFPLFKHIKKNKINLNKLWFPFIIYPIVHTLLEIFYFINPIAVELISYLFYTLGIYIIFLFLYNILSKVFEDTLKSALHSQEKDYYFNQCQLMQESVENIKSIHHDMNYHLATVRDFISNNKTKAATNYLDNLLGDVEKNFIYSNTKNTAFDSIINFKLKNAKQENIKLDLRLLVPPSLDIEVADIVIIIGNLLDNALDAVSKVEDKFIKLDIEYSRESLFIQIENTFNGVVKYAEEADEKDRHIITQKTEGEHGHGMKNIRKSVEKYNGYIDMNHDEKIFSVTVLLYTFPRLNINTKTRGIMTIMQ